MSQKEARKTTLWKAIERYRTAGGREEHHAYKEALDSHIDDMLDMNEENKPAAFLVEGCVHKGAVVAHILHFTVEEAKQTAAVFAQHYTTVHTVPLYRRDEPC